MDIYQTFHYLSAFWKAKLIRAVKVPKSYNIPLPSIGSCVGSCVWFTRAGIGSERAGIGSMRVCIGSMRVCIGSERAGIGSMRVCIGSMRVCIGSMRVCIGSMRVCIGSMRVCIGSMRVCIGSMRVCIGSMRVCIGSMRVCVGSERVFGWQQVGNGNTKWSHWGSSVLGGNNRPQHKRVRNRARPANCTVFDGTVPYFDPCTVCTLWY